MHSLDAALVGYIVGSLPLGFLIARGQRGIDLRRVGSGNVGATNVVRTAGTSLGVLVMLVVYGFAWFQDWWPYAIILILFIAAGALVGMYAPPWRGRG